jgi:hypothetical protein
MKKVILSIVTVIALASCQPTSQVNKKEMPTKVAYQFKNGKFDDTLHIVNHTNRNGEEEMYMFDKKNHFMGKINKTEDDGTPLIVMFIFILAIGIMLGGAIFG